MSMILQHYMHVLLLWQKNQTTLCQLTIMFKLLHSESKGVQSIKCLDVSQCLQFRL